MSFWIERRVCRVVGLEAVESSACELVRRKDIIPAATDQSFRPDIIRMKKVEGIDQKLGR